MKNKLITLFLIFVFVLTSGFGCKLQSEEVQQALQPITLNYWRVWDGPDAFDEVFAKYNAIHPNIKINYKKLRYDEYEEALLEAFAEDRGPDIFSINSRWVGKYQSKIVPMPAQISMVYPVKRGTIKEEIVPEMKTIRSISLTGIKDSFMDTVYDDVVLEGVNEQTKLKEQRVYGLPLSIDTLAMFYNKDLTNNAGISELSEYWDKKFTTDVKKLTKQNSRGDIVQSGIALGGGSNIERASDILTNLMVQNGADIIKNEKVSFTQFVQEKNYNPGLDALEFYTDFANPAKDVYSWNMNMDNSMDMFINGKVAIIFGYSYHLPTIRSQAPKLNFAIKKFPQIEGSPVDSSVADYWVETVSKKSKNVDEAWDLIQFMTTNPENAKMYLDETNKPTALKKLIETQRYDDELGIFVNQLLTSKNWYRGKNALTAERIFEEMIDSIAEGSDLEQEARIAAGKIRQTLR